MLTADEIEGAQQVAFRQQLEDADDAVLEQLAADEALLRTRLPPAMALAEGRAVVREIIDQRRRVVEQEPALPARSALDRIGRWLASALGRSRDD